MCCCSRFSQNLIPYQTERVARMLLWTLLAGSSRMVTQPSALSCLGPTLALPSMTAARRGWCAAGNVLQSLACKCSGGADSPGLLCVRSAGRCSIPVELEPPWGCGSYIWPVVMWIVYPACMVRRFSPGGDGVGDCRSYLWLLAIWYDGLFQEKWEADCVAASVVGCVVTWGVGVVHSACIVAVCPSIHPSIHLFHQSIHLFIHYFCCSQTVTNLKLQALSSFHNILTYCNRYECS